MDSSIAHMIGYCTTREQLEALWDHFDLQIDFKAGINGMKRTGKRTTVYFIHEWGQPESLSIDNELLRG
jgi:hypothetical protein